MYSSKIIKFFNVFLISILIISCRSESADNLFPANAAAEELYNTEVSAILQSKCISCHQGYHSDSYMDITSTISSLDQIIQRINTTDNTVMPPSSQPQLTEEELATLNEFYDLVNSDDLGSSDDSGDMTEEVEEVPFALSWTAYKYENRFTAEREDAGVGGTFNEIQYSFNTDYTDVIDVLDGAAIRILTSTVNVADNEPTRTGNVAMFFEAFTDEIVGVVTSYSDTEAVISFEMNGETNDVIMDVEVDDNKVVLSGTIEDMSIFNWDAGYQVLEDLCGVFHEGMLWPDVDLEAIINVDLVKEETIPVDLSWTAYKYPDRFTANREGAGVGGTFDEMEYSFNSNYGNLVDVLDGATIDITTSSVNVANNEPTRTGNVEMFFAAFTPNIVGEILNYNENQATVSFEMNGISENVILDVEVDELLQTVTLSGKIEDMAVFDWQAGYDALELVCGDLHEGRLWEDVDISVTIRPEEL